METPDSQGEPVMPPKCALETSTLGALLLESLLSLKGPPAGMSPWGFPQGQAQVGKELGQMCDHPHLVWADHKEPTFCHFGRRL